MKYSIKTTKTLKTDNNLNFFIGQDIAFMIYNEKSNCHNHYIGEITEITEDAIIIKNIEINKEYIDGKMIIDLNLIAPNSCVMFLSVKNQIKILIKKSKIKLEYKK